MVLLVHKWSVCRKGSSDKHLRLHILHWEFMDCCVRKFVSSKMWMPFQFLMPWKLECLFERFLLHMKLEQYVICFSIFKLFFFFNAHFPREQLVLGWWGGVRRGGWRPTTLAPIGTPRSLPTPLGGPRATGGIRRAGWSVLLRKCQKEQNLNGNRRASASGF